jgi:CxxC motif-containing protein (DUF1111 family)
MAVFASSAALLLTGATASAWQARVALETEISWQSTEGNSYQLQWSAAPGGGTWTDLGGTLPVGNSDRQSAYDGLASGRIYRVMETVPGSGEVLVATNALDGANPGFESGATGWNLGSIHSISSANPRSGTSSLRSYIPGGAVGVQLSKDVTSIVPGKAYSLAFHAWQESAGPSYVQQYRIGWVAPGGAVTYGGWNNFAGGDGAWAQITTAPVTAPGTAVGARIEWYFATGAVAGALGEVFLDDVEFTYQTTKPAVAEETQEIASETRRVLRLAWPSSAGLAYLIEESASLGSPDWSPVATVPADGPEAFHHVPVEGAQKFFRITRQITAAEPPANVRVVPTGIEGSISLAWDPSPSPGLTGYRIFYGTSAGDLDQFVDVGLVQSATVPDLAPGQTYYVTVAALSADGAGPASPTVLEAQPETAPAFLALYNADTVLEPEILFENSSALVTRVADRVRARHAREDIVNGIVFRQYDTYRPFYWEQRVLRMEIVDRVAKGGTGIVFNYTTLAPLNPAEFRAFFLGRNTVAEYYFNAIADSVGSGPSTDYPGETEYHYTITLTHQLPDNRLLRVGDRVEIELSQFLGSVRNGQLNYYGTTFLYVVGEGIVPWYEEREFVAGGTRDSRRLPEEAWLGGLTTLPYQYSNEPQHRFKQMAGNIAPSNGVPFLLGRRLHHTDFTTGAHSEAGNPVFAEQINKAGPKFVAQSCVACHVNNGRSLLPEVGAPLDRAVVKVGQSADGTPHPVLGEQLQPYAIQGAGEGAVTLAGFTEITGSYADGTPYTLRKPRLQFSGVTPSHYSLRVAPPLIGLGLLEAVPESTILALADPEDANNDGISGRVNVVEDPENSSALRLGRFTYKNAMATVRHQIAYAFNRDMEVTSDIFPILDGETTPRPPEISAAELDSMNRYTSLLGVGARRNLQDPQVIRGQQLFTTASCVACHTPTLTTGPYHPLAELRNQTIRPYTDLLLHDMGPGLADNMGDEGAAGSEWRTPPLWNIGLTAGVSGGEGYLHDGRARTLEEAILWHGGEAEQAKENFRNMPASDRSALIKFIQSL